MRAVFKDTVVDEQFKKDGFAVVNLLSTAAADNLLAAGLSNKHAANESFYTTIGDPVLQNRLLADKTIRTLIDGPLKNLLIDFDILYSTFITKKRGVNGKIGLHADWQFVEEPTFISINTWIALHDTGFWNGGLRVVKGSHTEVNQHRGPNYLLNSAVVSKQKNKPQLVTLKKGQAVLYDSRLLHASGYNIASAVRVAASALLIPKEAEPVYIYFKPGQSSEPYYNKTVPRNFYLEQCNFRKENGFWSFTSPE